MVELRAAVVWALACTPLLGCREPPGAEASNPVDPPVETPPAVSVSAIESGDAASPEAAPAEPPADPRRAHERIRECCGKLRSRAGDGGVDAAVSRWDVALSVCQSIAVQVEKGIATEAQARALIREQLQGGKPPEGC